MQRSARHTLTLVIGLAGLLILAACGEPTPPPPPTTTYDLTVDVSGDGTGTVTSDVGGITVTTGDDAASTAFDEGTTVTLTATPAGDSTFTGWEGDCSGTGTCEVTLDANASVTAVFGITAATTATLTVVASGPGNVTSPAGIDVDAGDTSVVVDLGTSVTLTATADVGFSFGGWSGGGCSGLGTCVVEVNSDLTVTAFFFDSATEVVTDTFSIVQGSDDAEEYAEFVNEFFDAGGTTLTSSDLDLTYDADFSAKVTVGLRFAGIDLPSNAVVTNATITFTRVPATSAPGSVTLGFAGQAIDNAQTFAGGSANFNITSRTTTTAAVEWDWVGSWTTAIATSPDLSSIVTEVLQRDGWSSGNALAFIINSADSDASNYRRAVSFENDPASAPVLSISYYVPTP